MQLFSAREAAERIGCDQSTVTRRCKSAAIGRRVGGRLVLTAGDISRLARIIRDAPGNPNFVPGNAYGRPPEPSEKIRK